MKYLKQEWVKGGIFAGFLAIALIIIYELGKHNAEVETYDLRNKVQYQKDTISILRDSIRVLTLPKNV